MVIAGALNLIWGITALSKKDYFIEGGLVWSSLSTWGWIAIVIAAVQIIAGGLLFARKVGGVIMAIVIAMCGMLVNFLSIGAYPVWSIVAIVCNGLVLWAVTVHGERLHLEPGQERCAGRPGRLEAFSDGVLAIAITLLVLEIKIEPPGFEHLWRALADEWPSYLAYVTSFLTIGGVWLAHHALFERLSAIDPVLMRLNILLLMAVSFLPFPTALMAEALQRVPVRRARRGRRLRRRSRR